MFVYLCSCIYLWVLLLLVLAMKIAVAVETALNRCGSKYGWRLSTRCKGLLAIYTIDCYIRTGGGYYIYTLYYVVGGL